MTNYYIKWENEKHNLLSMTTLSPMENKSKYIKIKNLKYAHKIMGDSSDFNPSPK